MGYLGSSLDDYFSYQLLDKVVEQIESGDTGDLGKLQNSLNRVVKKLQRTTATIGEPTAAPKCSICGNNKTKTITLCFEHFQKFKDIQEHFA